MIPPAKRRILLIDDQTSIHDDYRKIIGATSGANSELSDAEAELFGDAPAKTASQPQAQCETAELYDIDSAFSGEEAIGMVEKALAEGRPYAVAFVDIRMPPGIDGVKTMRRIWGLDSEILAVMCSAYSDYSWEAIVNELGRTDRFLILRKPFDTVEVRQCAAALTGRWAVARTDPLTGLLNRRSFEEHLRREWAQAVRHDRPLSCVMIDVDNFKAINSRCGHTVGDQALRVLASLLAAESRPGDVLCRYGGEEFCVLMPSAEQSVAVDWAERVRGVIAAQPLNVNGHTVVLTASFGVVDRKSAWQDDLLERADQALSDAKSAGRNRVVTWEHFAAAHSDEPETELTRLADSFGHLAPASDDVQRILQHAGLFQDLVARDLMTAPVICVPRDTPVAAAANLLLCRKIKSAPVINADGSLAGVVSERDIMETVGFSDDWSAPVERFMTEGVIQYDSDTPASIIFDFLCRVQIQRVVIVEKSRPVGLISRGTFLRWARNHLGTSDDPLAPVVSELLSIQDILANLLSWSRPASEQPRGAPSAATANR
jgi:diguanylate cyclase (GGDEF)-like protein